MCCSDKTKERLGAPALSQVRQNLLLHTVELENP
jgi:hypothetical protein